MQIYVHIKTTELH